MDFTNSIIALKHFKINERFHDVVFSDLGLPDINRVQLLKTVKVKGF